MLSYLLETGEERENVRAFQYGIGHPGGRCEDQTGASVLLSAFKVCACMCRVCYVMQLE